MISPCGLLSFPDTYYSGIIKDWQYMNLRTLGASAYMFKFSWFPYQLQQLCARRGFLVN